nr:MAG TPA: hypothetical protein [Caudoviricetes sp.]
MNFYVFYIFTSFFTTFPWRCIKCCIKIFIVKLAI